MTLHGWEGGVIEQSPERGKGKGEENLMRKANWKKKRRRKREGEQNSPLFSLLPSLLLCSSPPFPLLIGDKYQ